MGRSRECGLLVIGTLERERSVSRPAAANAGELAARWGLSPAQAEAAAAALNFLASPGRWLPPFSPDASVLSSLAGPGYSQLRPSSFTLQSLVAKRLANLLSSTFGRRNERSRLSGRTFLLWAVTGAGKTEMIFPLIDSVLASGGRVLIATPRRDVVLELAPRLSKAFPDAKRAVLYGGSADKFANAELTLATTHQLLRFQGAFDLVLIDELDAYPYHNNPMLHYAAAKAGKKAGATVLLSATPPAELKRQAVRGKLPHARVPVRHHGFPLPVPRRLPVPGAARWLQAAKPPHRLLKALAQSLDRGAQVFLFVPVIRFVEPLVELLRLHLRIRPDSIQGTSSEDEARTDKVDLFREKRIRLLVTTTILERGVTIPKSDVFVLDADKPLFDAAALEQMAGRAGRSRDDPAGRVYFAASSWTSAQRKACREIRGMNREAVRKGYLSANGRRGEC
ncbi:helicase-related protein [Cohnella faecalis]|uniref:DEAD/DEAH box helicase n=2 Tax=Cohnella faecalis TaxID=2315694 RepID=A0A398CSW4_9BACL|nr:helicase-related protein [Cohnella faecalis]RIE02054.1 hypothetical protein D3H35_14920 [Cohnella faecalis]